MDYKNGISNSYFNIKESPRPRSQRLNTPEILEQREGLYRQIAKLLGKVSLSFSAFAAGWHASLFSPLLFAS